MKDGCGCKGDQTSSGSGVPNLPPPQSSKSNYGSNAMNEQVPTLTPPVASSNTGAGDAAPSLTPASLSGGAAGAITAWNGDKRVGALWGINQNRNSWVFIVGVGWKRLANNSDTAVVALTMLAAHAKQSQTNYSYRDEADGMIHESYVW